MPFQTEQNQVMPSQTEHNQLNMTALETILIEGCNYVPLLDFADAPSLKKVEVNSCPKLEGITKFEHTRIEELILFDCFHLGSIPDLEIFPFLRKLTISYCGICSLSNYFPMVALKELTIHYCNIHSIEGLQELVCLEKLEISNCPMLSSLPKMDSFYSLTTLSAIFCDELMNLPKNGLPISLVSLCLISCDPVLMEQLHRKSGPEWDKVAALSKCKLYTCLCGKGKFSKEKHVIFLFCPIIRFLLDQ